MTEQQEARIMKAARELVAALNSVGEELVVEHTMIPVTQFSTDMPNKAMHRIDIRWQKTLRAGGEPWWT